MEGVKTFYLNRIFLEAMKAISPEYTDQQLKIAYLQPNRIQIQNWSDQNPICRKFKNNFDKVLDSINVMKLNQPERKVERIKLMKKWKKQFQIKGLTIITVKKNYGNVYYLMGCTSQLQLYEVLTNLQVHSYKKFSSNFVRFLYKPVFQALIESKDFQIAIYQKLKITSTEMRIITVENQNQKKSKCIELLFQLEEYVMTNDLVNKFKQFLTQEYFLCGLVFDIDKIQDVKANLQLSRISAWKIFEKKRQRVGIAYLISKAKQAKNCMSDVIEECLYIKHMTFLRGIGKTNQFLNPIVGNNDLPGLTEQKKFLLKNFTIKGNVEKNPNEISLTLKEDRESNLWIEALQKLA